MRIPRFWQKQTAESTDARGNTVKAEGWGWSENNVEEANSRAQQTAQRIVQWLIGRKTSDLHHYGYDERLPREEIIDEYSDDQGKPHAFISRNSYGALILNTRDLMFIDIDLPPAQPANPLAFLSALLGKKSPNSSSPEALALEEIRETAANFSDCGFRIYRTFNGYRLMVANRRLAAESLQANQLLQAFRTDPLYVRMCKNQQCFRARLTPKTWRCGIKKPTIRFPFRDAGAESEYRRWESVYNDGVRNFSTCSLVETIGSSNVAQEFEGLVAIHDQLSKVNSNDRLA